MAFTSHNNKPIPNQRPKLAPLKGDILLNEIFKMVFSSFIFFGLYFIFKDIIEITSNIELFLIAIILNIFAIITSYIASYFFIKNAFGKRYAHRGFNTLNKPFSHLYYNMINILLNSLVCASLAYTFLFNSINQDIPIFFLWWTLIKLAIALLSFIGSLLMERNPLLMILIWVLFIGSTLLGIILINQALSTLL
jgi:hypothetical protein